MGKVVLFKLCRTKQCHIILYITVYILISGCGNKVFKKRTPDFLSQDTETLFIDLMETREHDSVAIIINNLKKENDTQNDLLSDSVAKLYMERSFDYVKSYRDKLAKFNNDEYQGKYNFISAYVYFVECEYDTALQYVDKAEYFVAGYDKGQLYLLKAQILQKMGFKKEAREYFDMANENLAVNDKIGSVISYIELDKDSVMRLATSKEIVTRVENRLFKCTSFTDSMAYLKSYSEALQHLGNLYLRFDNEHDRSSALKCFLKAAAVDRLNGIKNNQANTSLLEMYLKNNDMVKAREIGNLCVINLKDWLPEKTPVKLYDLLVDCKIYPDNYNDAVINSIAYIDKLDNIKEEKKTEINKYKFWKTGVIVLFTLGLVIAFFLGFRRLANILLGIIKMIFKLIIKFIEVLERK